MAALLLAACATAQPGSTPHASGPSAHAGRWSAPPCAGTASRHCPLGQRADGPVMGNGDLGAMLGGPALSFWLTKNDYWNLATEAADPDCRYGTYSQRLFVPPMDLDTGCTITNGSDTRNSQSTAGGLTLTPLGDNVTASGWAATQHISNATVDGDFTLTSGATLRTRSFVAAPVNVSSAATISLLVTHVTVSGAGVILNVSTGAGRPGGPGAVDPEGWGTTAQARTPAPRDGLRAGKELVVAMATRAIGPVGGGATLSLVAGDSVILVTAVASSIDLQGADPTDAVSKAVRSATPSSVQALEAAHVAWWARYWAR